jgi:hypothetical protein
MGPGIQVRVMHSKAREPLAKSEWLFFSGDPCGEKGPASKDKEVSCNR